MSEGQHRLTVQWVQDLAAFETLRDEWRSLSLAAPGNIGFFASWDYVRACLHNVQPRHWCVLAVRDANERLVGVFPLQVFQMQAGQYTWRTCQTLGGMYATYIEFPVDGRLRRAVVQALLHALKQQHVDVLVLWPLHEQSWLYLALLEDMAGKPALMSLRLAGNRHEIDAQGQTLQDYFAGRPSSTLYNARYRERRLSREGEVRFTLNETAELDSLTRQLCEWNRQRFDGQHLYRDFARWSALTADLVSTLQPSGAAQLSTLRLNGRVIASAVSFLQKRRRYFNLFAFDPAYARFAASKIVLSHLVEETFRTEGEFCFGLGDYAYKRDWAQVVGEVKAAVVFLNAQARPSLEPLVDLQMLRRIAAA